jgi:hypothetical protein
LKKQVTALLKVSYSPQKPWECLKAQNTATWWRPKRCCLWVACLNAYFMPLTMAH